LTNVWQPLAKIDTVLIKKICASQHVDVPNFSQTRLVLALFLNPINIWDLSRDYQTQQNKHQITLLIMTSTALIAAGFNTLCGRASCWIQHFMQACLQHV
jgi:hypothetical protein